MLGGGGGGHYCEVSVDLNGFHYASDVVAVKRLCGCCTDSGIE